MKDNEGAQAPFTLPTGTISMSQVNTEIGKAATTKISLNDWDVRMLAGKLADTISMNDLRGKSSEMVVNLPSTGTNVDVKKYLPANYKAGTKLRVVVPANALYTATSPLYGALQCVIPDADKQSIIILGSGCKFIGKGGNGGKGGGNDSTGANGQQGTNGGYGATYSGNFRFDKDINNHALGGGGGGGGGGWAAGTGKGAQCAGGGGGGGGASTGAAGIGGRVSGCPVNKNGHAGKAASNTVGGAGGARYGVSGATSGAGGKGGNAKGVRGESGANGEAAPSGKSKGAGGNGGSGGWGVGLGKTVNGRSVIVPVVVHQDGTYTEIQSEEHFASLRL